jgi:hypothetical protein
MGVATEVPANTPLLVGTSLSLVDNAWMAFFQQTALRLRACEERLKVSEQRLLNLENRLAAAHIP